MSDFSFVSVEVGIPFATSKGALTIYDCNDASRYVLIRRLMVDWLSNIVCLSVNSCRECVSTENVCGWCVYGGLCSGTPDLCPVPAGVNNSYLTVIVPREPSEILL